jgi:hypothetical protein
MSEPFGAARSDGCEMWILVTARHPTAPEAASLNVGN